MFGLTKMQPQHHLYSMEKTLCKFTFNFKLRPFIKEKLIEIVPLSHVNSNHEVKFCINKPYFNVI